MSFVLACGIGWRTAEGKAERSGKRLLFCTREMMVAKNMAAVKIEKVGSMY